MLVCVPGLPSGPKQSRHSDHDWASQNALIDFALHLPRRQKLRRNTGKWLLKQVALKHLPRENVTAPKIGFGMSHAFSDGSEELLRDGLLRDVLRWDRKSLDGIIALMKDDNVSRSRLVGTEIFLRLYQRGDSQEDVADKLVGLGSATAT